jgi:catechol 2,3-dioxygenase-like lactoylglutathione lyase family enzyme
MTLLRIHHVQITVPPDQVETARQFYCGVMGLPEIEKPDSLKVRGGFWLQIGAQQIHIGVENGFDPRVTKGHIAYQVEDAAAWKQRLSAVQGVEIAESIPIPGFERFEFRDPFGIRCEIIQPLD